MRVFPKGSRLNRAETSFPDSPPASLQKDIPNPVQEPAPQCSPLHRCINFGHLTVFMGFYPFKSTGSLFIKNNYSPAGVAQGLRGDL